jgi:hypothetical protein
MEWIATALTKTGQPLTKACIEDRAPGRSQDVCQAIAALIDEGYVQQDRGPRNSMLHTLIRPFGKEQQ